jgi:hypothetical protein
MAEVDCSGMLSFSRVGLESRDIGRARGMREVNIPQTRVERK